MVPFTCLDLSSSTCCDCICIARIEVGAKLAESTMLFSAVLCRGQGTGPRSSTAVPLEQYNCTADPGLSLVSV